MVSFTSIYFLFAFLDTCYSAKRFNSHVLYEVTAFNARERAILYYLHIKNDMVIFLNGVTNEAAIPMDVIVDGCCTYAFEKKMQENDIEYIIIKDKRINKQINTFDTAQAHSFVGIPNVSADFHSWERLRVWVQHKLKKYKMLQEIIIGTTYEGREIFVLKISTGIRNTAVFLLSGENGRDWASIAIVFNFINDILERKEEVEMLTNYYDFYVLPILNPDGYVFSMTEDRYWSKNRKEFFPQKICSDNETAVGINIERNWFFNKSSLVRNEECASVYAGSKSLSEEETEALSNFLNRIALKMMAFIDLKGFERLVTVPYGFRTDEYPNNYAIMMDILTSVFDKVQEDFNITFYYGTSANYFYNFTGNCADWVKMNLNTPIVYSMYLKMEDYPLPIPEHIQPLTQHFSTMMSEALLLARSIYGPIFSGQPIHHKDCILIIIMLLLNYTLHIIIVKISIYLNYT